MLVYGSGGGNSVMGDAGTHECPVCKETSGFSAICSYTYWHIYWLFCIVTKREYYIACDACGNATPIAKKDVRAQFPRDNIPFLRRRGWLLLVLPVLTLLGIGIASDIRQERETKQAIAAFVAEPRVNDIVEMNLSFVPGSGFGPDNPHFKDRQAWGILKVVEIDEDGDYICATSMEASSERKGMWEAVRKGRVKYDMEGLVLVEKADLKRYSERGYIINAQLAKR